MPPFDENQIFIELAFLIGWDYYSTAVLLCLFRVLYSALIFLIPYTIVFWFYRKKHDIKHMSESVKFILVLIIAVEIYRSILVELILDYQIRHVIITCSLPVFFVIFTIILERKHIKTDSSYRKGLIKQAGIFIFIALISVGIAAIADARKNIFYYAMSAVSFRYIFSATYQELYFNKFINGRLSREMPKPLSIIVCSIFFIFSHEYYNIYSTLEIYCYGLLFFAVYAKYQRIIYTIILHWAIGIFTQVKGVWGDPTLFEACRTTFKW